MKQKVAYEDLGLQQYEKAWAYQTKLHQLLIASKTQARKDDVPYCPSNHYLLLCEHSPVFTLGRSGKKEHLLLDEQQISNKKFEFFNANRGGDITYHGPGQITGYPIFDLDYFKRDVHLYVRNLEEVMIQVIAEYGIEGTRLEGKTGVWIAGAVNQKICAIGVHLSRWVTLHGFALNVNTNLEDFKHIVPCGIQDENSAVCSMASILEKEVDIAEVKLRIKKKFKEVFDYDYLNG